MSESDEIDAAMRRAEANLTTQAPDEADTRAMRDALGRFATGVAVITAYEHSDADRPVGITVNSFASVSLSPALILWSAARSSLRHAHFTQAPAFAVHVLRHDQEALARRFTRNGDGFSGLDYRINAQGVPVFDDTLARFECLREARHDGGDHTIIIGRVERFSTAQAGEPLVFAHGQFGRFLPNS
ncbi:NADH-FMN oxidoreductase RutF, flavin reductase (DIM6/NTAB) family [Thioclava dalianensis]|nr:NADH-FMN oxidoreductase RutF, flavin reductase (DIM6/NTAB) family [Thioclava dalianensis]